MILSTKSSAFTGMISKGKLKLSKVSGLDSKQSYLTIGFLNSYDFILGLKNGNLAAIRGNSVSENIEAHKSMVTAMASSSDRSRLFTGGNDGMIIS